MSIILFFWPGSISNPGKVDKYYETHLERMLCDDGRKVIV